MKFANISNILSGSPLLVVGLPRHISIIDLFGAHHTLGMCNVRLYFDPMLSRFSFIGFDADSGIRPANRYLSIDSNLCQKLQLFFD